MARQAGLSPSPASKASNARAYARYQLVKAVYDNQPRLLKATSAASDALPQNVDKNTFLPLHPGAVRYYREIGINIPDLPVPTN